MSDLTVLVALDGSKPAELALSFLTALSPLENLRVRLITVAESDGSISGEEERQRERRATDYLDSIGQVVDAAYGLPVERIIRTGKPYAEILEEASSPDVNLILMTTHGRTIGDIERLGSVTDKVVRGAECPTLLVGPDASIPLKVEKITVPLDGSALAAEALPVARSLAERLGSSLRLVRSVQYPFSMESDSIGSLSKDVVESVEMPASLYLSEAELELETLQPVETVLLSGTPAEALLTDVRENPPDLLVMTSHGHTGFIPWALGSVTDRLIRGPAPMLVLRPTNQVGDRMGALTKR